MCVCVCALYDNNFIIIYRFVGNFIKYEINMIINFVTRNECCI